MTIEQKSKAYDEALERAKKELQACGSTDCDAARQIFRLFPELKESEDEKVRKEIINIFHSLADGKIPSPINFADIFTWLEKQGYTKKDVDDAYLKGICNTKHELEKQGERKPTDKIEIGKKYQCIASPRYSTFRRGEIYKPVDNFLCNLMNLCSDCFEPIEDSEHNPILDFKAKDWYVSKVDGKIHNIYYSVDKTEPKFHEGEWIVQGYNILKIKCVGDTYYCFETVGGYVDDMLISEIDSQFHLWTIKDAKNGDVLINKNYMGESPFIFKETKPSNIKTDVPNPLTVLGYCGIGGAGFTKSSGWGDTANCIYYPATKSQRGTLLKAMADAGYTFDFEKKESKKIEPEHEDETTSAIRNEEAYKIGFIDGKAHAKEEMESSWSEEDDYNLQCIIAKVVSDIQNGNVGRNEELIDWLKSLKPNKDMVEALRTEYEKGRADAISEMELSWGEEDEKMVNDIIAAIDTLYYHGMVNWLKSLKDRYTWKPSKEQIMALRWVLNNIPYDSHKEEISGLLDQIKKL